MLSINGSWNFLDIKKTSSTFVISASTVFFLLLIKLKYSLKQKKKLKIPVKLENLLHVHPEKYRSRSTKTTRSSTPVDLEGFQKTRSRSADYL
uniref:Ovule protein n=1 Tax=Syphacia muris TaxID=451379 RepID=A0A0N5AHJ9_9BILA